MRNDYGDKSEIAEKLLLIGKEIISEMEKTEKSGMYPKELAKLFLLYLELKQAILNTNSYGNIP